MIWLDHVPSLIMDGHAPPGHASIIVLSHTSSIDKIYSRVAPTSHPWNFHETSFYTASAFKAVLACKSGVWPSPFSPGYLRVFPRHRGSPGCDHPWSNILTGSSITSPFSAHETAFLHTSALKAVHAIESGVRPSPFPPDHLSVFPGHRGSLGHDHPWSITIKGSFSTPLVIAHKTASLLPSHHSWSWMEQSDSLSLFLWFSLCFRV